MATINPEPASLAGEPPETRLEYADNRKLIDLCGAFDRNLAVIEQGFGVAIQRRGNVLALHGEPDARARAQGALDALYQRLETGRSVEPGDVDAAIRMPAAPQARRAVDQLELFEGGRVEIRTRKKTVEPRTEAQKAYARALFKHELVFGVGPAGTGKTYLAVAAAVAMFIEGRVDKIILSRPAVEAGERLGFLPGDMKEKIDPYLRPLYDAIHDMLPGKQLQREMELGNVEVAPLAFMRGRTLANAFVVLDEAQNTTEMQMKMFLTRLGEGSRMAITGDPTQIDLPRGTRSGLDEAARVLEGVQGIAFCHFGAADVVRHPLVARIVEAYGRATPAPT
ncbi:MAG: phosphate starvation-inducible protein PhoH [Rhodobacterales bacterium CG_4_10_14_0_8_um_filter_70_9]|nr:MAG: phosphate starvation-inducible protein PhoH [Rhodobacterales bacterium CG_4_10_14_0_8_um_filter_70_9]PJA59835.1 MAG: phosphate starvation-inducible protein PhoH [Rhodobacterales bacterium CG_4_9_14_3_um_filter_71_31]